MSSERQPRSESAPPPQVSSTGLLEAIDSWHSVRVCNNMKTSEQQAGASASGSAPAAPAASPDDVKHFVATDEAIAAPAASAAIAKIVKTFGKPRLFVVGLAYGAFLFSATPGKKPKHYFRGAPSQNAKVGTGSVSTRSARPYHASVSYLSVWREPPSHLLRR